MKTFSKSFTWCLKRFYYEPQPVEDSSLEVLHGSCSQLNQGCRDTTKSFEALKSVLLEKIFLKISPNLMKTPVSESLFNKVIGFLPVTLSQKETQQRCFPCKMF